MRIPRRQLQPPTHRWPAGHPPLWIVLIAANTGIFLAQKLVDTSQPDIVENWLGLTSAGISHGYFWQFFTYSFLHLNLLHLLANMVLLYFGGREVEALVGARHFLAIYFGGGLVGGIAQWLAGPAFSSPVIGATACVLAVVIAFTTALPELELNCLLFFVIPLRMKAKTLAASITGVTLFFILIPYVARWMDSISVSHYVWLLERNGVVMNHYANLAGCLLGWLYMKQMGYGNPWRIQKYFFDRRQLAERRKRMTSSQFMIEEIDPILEKISRDGVRSLTRREKQLLEMGREKIEHRGASRHDA